MSWISLLALSVALAMDAFAVAIVTGLTLRPMTGRHVFRLAFHFGLFQALMPTIGWAAGKAVYSYIAAFDHWIAFCLLTLVGTKMVWEAARKNDTIESSVSDPTSGLSLFMLSVATSIDALAVGLSLALIGSAIVVPSVVIGLVAAAFTTIGMVLGQRVGAGWGKRVQVFGGIVLIGIGIKIVMEHVLA
jgi:putative Mn2+ efflux pump MntP